MNGRCQKGETSSENLPGSAAAAFANEAPLQIGWTGGSVPRIHSVYSYGSNTKEHNNHHQKKYRADATLQGKDHRFVKVLSIPSSPYPGWFFSQYLQK
jgi:hypothetical protein